jgi:hypothetical protein
MEEITWDTSVMMEGYENGSLKKKKEKIRL